MFNLSGSADEVAVAYPIPYGYHIIQRLHLCIRNVMPKRCHSLRSSSDVCGKPYETQERAKSNGKTVIEILIVKAEEE